MTMELTLKVVEQVLEGDCGEWAYRFIVKKDGVLVRRVNKDKRLWNHGVLVQMFDAKAGTFLPSNVCGSAVYFADLAEALRIVEKEVK